jgi:dienelactone hydrolase
MAQAIAQRLKESKFKYDCQLVKYSDAGHTLNERGMIGGTPEGNGKARVDSAERMFEFLAKSRVDRLPATAP